MYKGEDFDWLSLTYYVYKCEKFAEEVSIRPPVVVFEVIVQVIEKQFFLLLFLDL